MIHLPFQDGSIKWLSLGKVYSFRPEIEEYPRGVIGRFYLLVEERGVVGPGPGGASTYCETREEA